MRTLTIDELCSVDFDFKIFDVFPERWMQRKEFALYKHKERPHGALFFVLSDIEVTFLPMDLPAVTVTKGDVVFIPRGSLYSVTVKGETGEKDDTYTINFDIRDGDGVPITLGDRISVLANRRDSLWDSRLRAVADGFYGRENGGGAYGHSLARLKGEFLLLLDGICEAVKQSNELYYPIRRGIDLLCAEWNKNERIDKYARLCGISVTYFYRCFRRWAGVSPVEYRNRLRLSNACSLLRCTDMQVKDISHAVGYDDPFYFCRIFTAAFGISPRSFRNGEDKHSAL